MLQPGDILFIRSHGGPIDDAIQLGEHILDKQPYAKCYTHVCVYVGGSTIMEAQGLRKSGAGNIGDYQGLFDVGHVKHLSDMRRRLFISALSQENDLPYDWSGIFWLAVKVLTGYDKHYREHRTRYCSKYVGWALRQAGIPVNDETPESLALDPRIDLEKGHAK
jgi:cell wall-associated NlpC family hydrolase